MLGLQVLLLGENPPLQGKLATAAILAIARHGKLGNLALPNLPGVMFDILRKSKNLSRLSSTQLRYTSFFIRGSHAEEAAQASLSKHWPVAEFTWRFCFLLLCCTLPACCSLVSCVYRGTLLSPEAGPGMLLEDTQMHAHCGRGFGLMPA